MILENEKVLQRIREFFSDPRGFVDLPHYLLATWEIHHTTQGAIYNTQNLQDLQALYFILTSEVKELRIYSVTPQKIAFLIEYFLRDETLRDEA